MISISNDQLADAPTLNAQSPCPICGQLCEIKSSADIEANKDNKTVLNFIQCPNDNKTFLVGIEGKKIL